MKNVIRKSRHEAAQELDAKRFDEVRSGGVRVMAGPGARHFDAGGVDKALCIMEATSYILGYDRREGLLSDSPPCTSGRIRDFMIGLNDSDAATDARRARLVEVIPDIVNTAPTTLGDFTFPLFTDWTDPDYVNAEGARRRMVHMFLAHHDCNHATELWTKASVDEILAFIREMADVARFDSEDNEGRDR